LFDDPTLRFGKILWLIHVVKEQVCRTKGVPFAHRDFLEEYFAECLGNPPYAPLHRARNANAQFLRYVMQDIPSRSSDLEVL
jgi:hypothetical protein